jgi:hypothetical protein
MKLNKIFKKKKFFGEPKNIFYEICFFFFVLCAFQQKKITLKSWRQKKKRKFIFFNSERKIEVIFQKNLKKNEPN